MQAVALRRQSNRQQKLTAKLDAYLDCGQSQLAGGFMDDKGVQALGVKTPYPVLQPASHWPTGVATSQCFVN